MKTNDKKNSTKIQWDIVHMQINSKNVALFQVNPKFFGKCACVKDLTIVISDHPGVQNEEPHNPKDKEGLV